MDNSAQNFAPNLRVCYFGTYRADYVRNRLMIDRLKSRGVQVTECHETLWQGSNDRVQVAAGGWLKPSFWFRLVKTYVRLIQQFLRQPAFDVMVVGYPGHLDIYLARVLCRIIRKPLVWDVLMSIVLISEERGLQKSSPNALRLIKTIERIGCNLPDILIVDTLVFSEWYQSTYGVLPHKIRLLPLGADDRIFKPVSKDFLPRERFICLYYGTFIPNHGVQYILDAANILKSNESIHFELIGQGPEVDKYKQRAEQDGLTNITFYGWMEPGELVSHANQVDVCLGTFAKTPQAVMTMHNKVHESLAMALPVITGDSPAIRLNLIDRRHILLCERENGAALSEAILTLFNNPELRRTLTREGHSFYLSHFSFEIIGELLITILLEKGY